MVRWEEEELAEFEEKVVLAELSEIKKIFTDYLKNAIKRPYLPPDKEERVKRLFTDAAKHNPLVAAHSRKALQYLGESRGKRRPYSQQVSFMTKEEDAVIRTTMNIESAIIILEQHYGHFFNMQIQHESFLGQPRQSGYTPFLLKRQAGFILTELDKVINPVQRLIQLEENLKRGA